MFHTLSFLSVYFPSLSPKPWSAAVDMASESLTGSHSSRAWPWPLHRGWTQPVGAFNWDKGLSSLLSSGLESNHQVPQDLWPCLQAT